LLITLVLCLAAIAINPRGLILYKSPLSIFNQLHANKYTTELLNISNSAYWGIEATVLLITIVLSIYSVLKFKNVIYKSWYLLLISAFVILACLAQRNIIFCILITWPLAVQLVSGYFTNTKLKLQLIAQIIGVLLLICIVSNKWYSITGSKQQYGLYIVPHNNPIGLSNYLAQQGLANKPGFVDYISSSYLLYAQYPHYKSFIDLRDLDVFTQQDFYNYAFALNNPTVLRNIADSMQLAYIALPTYLYPKAHQYFAGDTVYACTYVDGVNAVYQRTDNLLNGNYFSTYPDAEQSTFALVVSKLFNPLFNLDDQANYNYTKLAAQYFIHTRQLVKAQQILGSRNADNANLYDSIAAAKAFLQ
jgi:hypothetical protein